MGSTMLASAGGRRIGAATAAPIGVARAIPWLASSAASYCTGAILDVSGGR